MSADSAWPERGRVRQRVMRGTHPAVLGAAAAACALLVILGPAALGSGVHAGAVTAPYKGVVSRYLSVGQYGCGFAKIAAPWSFNLTTGVGGGAMAGQAVMCKAAQYGTGAYSSQYAYSGVNVGIALRAGVNATHVRANVSAAWAASVRASDGGRPLCDQGNRYDDTYNSASWGYTKTPVGNYYTTSNYSYWYRNTNTNGHVTDTTWSNGTSRGTGTAPIPHPWNFNNTSSFSWTHNWGGSASCQSSAQVYAYASAYLIDETNGSYIPQSASTVGTSGQFFNFNVNVYNYTSWSCSNSTNWNGPSAAWSNSTLSCSQNNGTVTASWYSYYPAYTHGSGNNNSVSLSSPNAIAGGWFWNYSFNHLHHYELFFSVFGYGDAYNTWPRGQGSFVQNMATLGNAFKLTAIDVT